MTSIEKRIVKDEKNKLQYMTLSRGINNSELPDELKSYERHPGVGVRVNATVRFDDNCKNGHCTFSISGSAGDSAGQITDVIEFAFPELRTVTKWHLTSTDGPMHYAANAVYLAGDRDYNGRCAGEPSAFEFGVRFNGVPVTHRIKKPLYEFLKERAITSGWKESQKNPTLLVRSLRRADRLFQVFPIAHEERKVETYKYAPHYSIVGYPATKWHECPFSDKTEAEEFCAALNTCTVEFVQVPTAWSEGKARELDSAGRAAIWPEATDGQMSTEPPVLKAALEARLLTRDSLPHTIVAALRVLCPCCRLADVGNSETV